MADVLRAFEEHRQTVYRLALHHTGSVHDAEDICQSAFLRLAEHADRVGDAAAKAWLIRVTINLCRDHARERMRHGTEETDETIAAPQEDREVLQKVMELPEKDRAPLIAAAVLLLALSVSAALSRISMQVAGLYVDEGDGVCTVSFRQGDDLPVHLGCWYPKGIGNDYALQGRYHG